MNGLSAQRLAEPSTRRKARLLLVEDEPAEYIFLLEMLQEHYEIELARNGLRAWELAQLHPPDLVLSDVVMPGLDGFTLVRRLRAYPPTAKVPILLLSASSKIELLVRGLVAGADEVLLKPILWEELLEALRAKLKE